MGQASGRLEPAVCPHVESGDLGDLPHLHCLPILQGPGLPGGFQQLLLGALHREKAEARVSFRLLVHLAC